MVDFVLEDDGSEAAYRVADRTQIYDRTLVAVLKEDRKALKELVRESKEMYDESHKIKYSLMPALRKMKGSGLELSLYYIQVVDYLNEMAKALVHITNPNEVRDLIIELYFSLQQKLARLTWIIPLIFKNLIVKFLC